MTIPGTQNCPKCGFACTRLYPMQNVIRGKLERVTFVCAVCKARYEKKRPA